MKIIVNESQYRVLNEQKGIDEFLVKVTETYPDSVYSLGYINDFIKKSGCQSISIAPLKNGVGGVSLHDGLILNSSILKTPFSFFLYVLFHEVAHQYQYSKYGIDVMYGCYTGDVSLEDGAKWMQNTEKIADTFSLKKLNEFKRLYGDRYKITIPNSVYKDVPFEHFVEVIKLFTEEIKKQGYQNKKDISEILFNYVKT